MVAMDSKWSVRLILLSILFVLISLPGSSQDQKPADNERWEKVLKKFENLKFSADFRVRAEYDWDSKNSSSASNNGKGKRDDRARMRYRMRFGFTFNWNKNISVGARLRTGVPQSLQSPHVNFGYKGLGMVPFNLDKVYIQGKYEKIWWWIGKNSYPFWKQNELFWDDDITPEGFAVGGKFGSGSFSFQPTLAYFMANNIPVDQSNSKYAVNGSGFGNGDNVGDIYGVQLKTDYKADNFSAILALNYMKMTHIFLSPELHPNFSSNKDNDLNYDFFGISGQFKFLQSANIPLVLGYDYVNNMEDYGDEKLVADHLKDDKTSHTVSLSLGKKGSKGNFQFTYYYAIKEMYSVVSYYTEDDWGRWGNIFANRNTNFKGHEFRFLYTVNKKMNVMARYYKIEGIKMRNPSTNDQLETGDRFRVDLNVKL